MGRFVRTVGESADDIEGGHSDEDIESVALLCS